MGLEKPNISVKEDGNINDVIDILLELRHNARKNKDFELSDKIRNMLKEKGISINDNDKDSSFTIS